MGLTEEMIKNGWVTEIDEYGQSITYNKKLLDNFFGQPPTDKPTTSVNFEIIDITKPKDKQ